MAVLAQNALPYWIRQSAMSELEERQKVEELVGHRALWFLPAVPDRARCT